MKQVDYIIYTINQQATAWAGQPYQPTAGHRFDWRAKLLEIGVDEGEFCGAGTMRLFDRKLLTDYTPIGFFDDIVRRVVAEAVKGNRGR
ncbi:MAG: hypothetical protein LBL21_04275 [Rickettsiales bacterium]|jgi:hypothetical protein|nr:hypothetical protein [Rickettsiales bacterium]